MTKSELFKRMWVSIDKRLPPETEEIFLFKTATGIAGVTTGLVINNRFEEEQEADTREIKYRITHWIKIIL